MNIAIQKLIATLKDKPDDSLLLDRIASLLSMEPDSPDKVSMTMDLAKAIEISRPRVALIFAKAIYEHQPQNLDCLQLIADLFTRLGKHAKAEVIKVEAGKLREILQKKIHASTTVGQGKFQLTVPPQPPNLPPPPVELESAFAETVHSIVSVIEPVAQDLENLKSENLELSEEIKKMIPDFAKVLRTSVAPISMIQVRRAPKLARMAVFDPKGKGDKSTNDN